MAFLNGEGQTGAAGESPTQANPGTPKGIFHGDEHTLNPLLSGGSKRKSCLPNVHSSISPTHLRVFSDPPTPDGECMPPGKPGAKCSYRGDANTFGPGKQPIHLCFPPLKKLVLGGGCRRSLQEGGPRAILGRGSFKGPSWFSFQSQAFLMAVTGRGTHNTPRGEG